MSEMYVTKRSEIIEVLKKLNITDERINEVMKYIDRLEHYEATIKVSNVTDFLTLDDCSASLAHGHEEYAVFGEAEVVDKMTELRQCGPDMYKKTTEKYRLKPGAVVIHYSSWYPPGEKSLTVYVHPNQT